MKIKWQLIALLCVASSYAIELQEINLPITEEEYRAAGIPPRYFDILTTAGVSREKLGFYSLLYKIRETTEDVYREGDPDALKAAIENEKETLKDYRGTEEYNTRMEYLEQTLQYLNEISSNPRKKFLHKAQMLQIDSDSDNE